LELSLENACAGGGGFGLGNVAGGLEGDRERGVGQRVGGSESSEGEGGTDGLLQRACVAKGANQPVVGFVVSGIGGDGGAKGLGRSRWLAGCKQGYSVVRERSGGRLVGCGHGSLQDNGWDGLRLRRRGVSDRPVAIG
jgi:hypothetical protein